MRHLLGPVWLVFCASETLRGNDSSKSSKQFYHFAFKTKNVNAKLKQTFNPIISIVMQAMSNKANQNLASCLIPRRSAEEALRKDGARSGENISDEDIGDSLSSVIPPRKRSRPGFLKETDDELVKRQRVGFEKEVADTYAADPPNKRRRFQRRNSKTAKMLFESISVFATSDHGESEQCKSPSRCTQFDENIEMAEDLVRQLNFYRQGKISTK
jgi:hypothetical protein